MIPDEYQCPMHGAYPTIVDGGRRSQNACPTCEAANRATTDQWQRAHVIFDRWTACGIPTRYRNRTFDNFRASSRTQVAMLKLVGGYVDNFAEHFEAGRGLAMVGPVGTGKSHLAIAALSALIALGWRGRFVTVDGLFARIKRGFGNADADGDQLLEDLASTELLVLDDIGAQRGTEWEAATLHSLLARRYDEAMPTIVTTNSHDLARFVGDRIADRFRECMLTVELSDASYREEATRDRDLATAPPAIASPPEELEVPLFEHGAMRTHTETWKRRGSNRL